MSQQFGKTIPLDTIIEFLKTRQGKLDAVTITGGEPTLQSDLIDVIHMIKKMGFLVKLDSNGSNPVILQKIIDENIVDYLAIDIKAPLEKYSEIIGFHTLTEEIQTTINLVIHSDIDHEFRTTIVKSLTSIDNLRTIAKTICGAKRYYLQQYVASKILDPALINETSYSLQELKIISNELKQYVKICDFR